MLHSIGILGGVFNPVHRGHLDTARALKKLLNFDEMRMLPCHIPFHREAPEVRAVHRLNMLKLALQEYPELTLDQRELDRDSISYSIDSLIEIRASHARSSICFCMGSDTYSSILTWHRYQELLNYCHIVVANRNNAPQSFSKPLLQWQEAALVSDKEKILNRISGCIFHCEPTQIPISSTALRQSLGTDNAHVSDYLQPSVADYALQQHLYNQ